ncbi:MAG: UDP-N-acetylmuramoyl-L-alanine--D-glutamate ligase [Pseudomonadota bacterium]
MIALPGLKNRLCAVYGLGVTGLAAAEALSASGAQVFAWDESEEARAKTQNTAYDATHPSTWPWPELQFLCLSPGVPHTHPAPHKIVAKAREAGVKIIGDLELFAWALDALDPAVRPTVIAVTGSNGKSTTTALIAYILNQAGEEASMGGNIGRPLLSLEPLRRGRFYVLELSSYQLELAESFRANVSVLLNVSPDHLERHGGMAGYLAAKQRIFYNQTPDDTAVVGVDDEHTQGVCAVLSGRRAARVVPISSRGALGHGVYALGGRLFYHFDEASGEAGPVGGMLRGPHNWQNAAAALAAVAQVGVSPAQAVKAMERFKGLAHRMETVARAGPVVFVNDSKATNAAAAARAVAAFDDVFLIAGGVGKDGGLAPLAAEAGSLRGVYLIGQSAAAFEKELGAVAPCRQCGNLAAAVAEATRDAQASGAPAPTVLLAPAAASFDQFKDFQDRGEAFRRLALAEAARAGADAPVADARGPGDAQTNGEAA